MCVCVFYNSGTTLKLCMRNSQFPGMITCKIFAGAIAARGPTVQLINIVLTLSFAFSCWFRQ